MKKTLLSRLSTAALLAATTFIAQPTDTQAGGFYLYEYGPNVGRAFAGDVAGGYDASTIYANPAGMMLLKKPQVQGGGTFVLGKTTFTNTNLSSTAAPAGFSVSTDNGGDPFDTQFVPNLYVFYPFEHISFGLGITSPFGLKTEYNEGWVGRFDSIKAELKTINFQPTVAFDVTDWLTFGIGANIQYADAELIKAKTFAGAALLGIPAGQNELRSKLKGTDWSVGANVGLLWKVTDSFNIGFDWNSATTHALEGDAELVAVANSAANNALMNSILAAGGLNTFRANADLRLPNIFTVGASWDVTDVWNLGFSAQWFNWNRFNEIRVTNKDALVVPGIAAGSTLDLTPENYKNTFSIAVGSSYCITPSLEWQLGYRYDQTPTRDGFRDSAVPDGNRNWISTGLDWEFMPGFSVNVGYAHIFVSNETINVTRNASAGAVAGFVDNTTLTGTLDSHVDLVSVNGRIEF